MHLKRLKSTFMTMEVGYGSHGVDCYIGELGP